MELAHRLIDVYVPDDPAGAVLVLHGGGSRRGRTAVSPTQLSVLRMIPTARGLARAGDGRLAVFRLLNSHRGWDASHTPVRDAEWALEVLAERLGPVPTCLVGHSLGGRAALLAAGHPRVRGVVALAPYVYPDDIAPGIAGTPVLIVHGTDDRVAAPARTVTLAERLARRTAVDLVTVPGGRHAMLRHHHAYFEPTREFVRRVLVPTPPHVPLGRAIAGR